MKTNILKSIFVTIVIMVIIGVLSIRDQKALGSVNIGNGYMFKTITTSNASSTAPTVVTVRGGGGILGSITIASSSNTVLKVYDGITATSTGTLISTIKASVSEQTFTFDTNVTKGIILDMPQTFTGVYTITYR